MIRAIYATDIQGGIGRNGSIPWPKQSADLKWFKESTDGDAVIMGRKTWMDPKMPKPLKNRYNVVVSDRGIPSSEIQPNITIGRSEIEKYAKSINTTDVWIIGGATLIESCWDFIEEAWVGSIEGIHNCDVLLETPKHFQLFEIYDNFDTGLSYEKSRNTRL